MQPRSPPRLLSPVPSYNLPALPSVSATELGCPTGAMVGRERAEVHGRSLSRCSSLGRSNRDARQIRKLRQSRGVELRPGSPTLITIGRQGVFHVSSSQGIRRDVLLDVGLWVCAELARRLPSASWARSVLRRFGWTPGDKDLPQPSVRQLAHLPRERPRTSILRSPSRGSAGCWSSPGVTAAARPSLQTSCQRNPSGGWFGVLAPPRARRSPNTSRQAV